MLLRLIPSLAVALALAAVTFPSGASAQERITNGNFNAGATGFNTSYDQTNDGGLYQITTDPALICPSCFPSMGDHTTGSGNMLFVDGAGVGDGAGSGAHPYYSVTLGVVPNSVYTFSYYTANLGTGGPNPLLGTYLNGVLLGSTFTPAYAQWTLFTNTFNSGSLSSITLALSDLTATHSFNDFALDDVSLQGPVPGTPGVPEPSAWALMLLGFGAIGATMRLRGRKLLLAYN